jgi:hypothetical protein
VRVLTRANLDNRIRGVRLYDELIRDVIADLGGRDRLSRIELSLIEALAGCYLQLHDMNCRLMLGQSIDPTNYGSLTSGLVRLSSRLGLQRRTKDVTTPNLNQYLEAARIDDDDALDVEE